MATIRPYRDPDRVQVTALWREVFTGDSPWNEPDEVIRRKLTVQRELFLVADASDRVIGTVLAGFDGVRGWVHHLAVTPSYRRQGIGGELMRAAERGLGAVGCPKLNLQVRATNSGVVAFYESLGYVVEERVSMGKPLERQGV